jgi:hypothetical protein
MGNITSKMVYKTIVLLDIGVMLILLITYYVGNLFNMTGSTILQLIGKGFSFLFLVLIAFTVIIGIYAIVSALSTKSPQNIPKTSTKRS